MKSCNMYELVVVDVVVVFFLFFFYFFIEDVSISWYCYIYTQGKKKTKQNKKQRTDFGFQGFLNRLCSCIS